MSEATVYKVRFEPVGIEMDVEEGETVLDAAFRQGIALMHGCKEGQCGSCKSKLISGEIELLKYSTFALPDYEREAEHVLLCKTHAHSDIEIELLNFDEDLLSHAIAVKPFDARLTKVTALTHDIRLLEIEVGLADLLDVGQVLARHARHRNVEDVEVLAPDQVQQQIERPFEGLEEHLQRIRRDVQVGGQREQRLAVQPRHRDAVDDRRPGRGAAQRFGGHGREFGHLRCRCVVSHGGWKRSGRQRFVW